MRSPATAAVNFLSCFVRATAGSQQKEVVALNAQSRFPKSGSLGAVSCALLMALSALAMTGCGGGGEGGTSSQPASSTAEVADEAAPVTTAPVPTPASDFAPSAPAPTPTPVSDAAPSTPAPTLPPASDSAPSAPAPTPNQVPTISGSAPSVVNANGKYDFVPAAIDADGDSLVFDIQNKPSWANFSTTTGTLTGTPGAADVGTYSNIVISVSDGKASSTMAAFSISVEAISNGRVTLQWMPPTENTDGSALNNLAGYKIHYGTDRSQLTHTVELDNSGLASYVVEDLAPGTWYFAITAVSAAGAESAQSNIAAKTI